MTAVPYPAPLFFLTVTVLSVYSQDGDYVICGSENGSVYVWNKARCVYLSLCAVGRQNWLRPQTDTYLCVLKNSKQDRNASYEYFCGEFVSFYRLHGVCINAVTNQPL